MVWLLLPAYGIRIPTALRPHLHAFQYEMVISRLPWLLPRRLFDLRHLSQLHNTDYRTVHSRARERWDLDGQFCSGVPCDAVEETACMDSYCWTDVSYFSTVREWKRTTADR
jgi:hypothetical protein